MPIKKLRGEISVPGDKSISHRAIMFGSISKGITRIEGFLNSADCQSSITCFKKMGVKITNKGGFVFVNGVGLTGLNPPDSILNVGNSGTTMRLISGILSGQDFSSILDGDESIRKRPMQRIIDPLNLMGAFITSNNGMAPIEITGHRPLLGIDYTLPIASAQVKSCILLAGLYANSPTTVRESALSRNHTERMLSAFGADIKVNGLDIILTPGNELKAMDVIIPGDISSAAYFIVAALIHPDADILIKNVNINPTRAGIIEVIHNMGGDLEILDKHIIGGEEVCNLRVRSSKLKGITIEGDIIPSLIDEIPIIAVMAAFADGTTIIRDAKDLKNKESNRINTVTSALSSMGADISATEDGMIINGNQPLHGAHIITKDDHRIAMSFFVPSLIIPDITLDNPECVNISFTDFYKIWKELIG